MKSDEQKHLPWSLSLKTRRFLSLMTGIGNICVLIAAIAALVQAHTLLQSRADPYASCLYEKQLEAKQVLEADAMDVSLKLMNIFTICIDQKYLNDLPLSLLEVRLTRPSPPQKISFPNDCRVCEPFFKAIKKYNDDLFRYIPILGEETGNVCFAFLNGTVLNFASGIMTDEEREQYTKGFREFAERSRIKIDFSQPESGFLSPAQAIKNQSAITHMLMKTFSDQLGIEAFDVNKVLACPNPNTFGRAIQEMVNQSN